MSRIFHFRIIREFLNLQTSTHAVYKACKFLLVRTLNLRGIEFAKISGNYVLANISKFTEIIICKCILVQVTYEKSKRNWGRG